MTLRRLFAPLLRRRRREVSVIFEITETNTPVRKRVTVR